MAKSDFSWVNAVDTATFVAASEVATLPSANLAEPRFGRIWRSLTTTPSVTITFAGATVINVLALAGCTLASTDQIRHRLYNGASLLLDVTENCGVLTGYGLHVHLLASPLTVTSWKIDITATSRAAAGYCDIARAWAGPVWRPAIGIALPWDESWEDGAVNVRGVLSGALFVGDGPQYRTVNLKLDFMSDADKVQAKELARVSGRRGQVLVIPDEGGDVPREAILGHIDKMQPITCSMAIVPPVYSQQFALIQDL